MPTISNAQPIVIIAFISYSDSWRSRIPKIGNIYLIGKPLFSIKGSPYFAISQIISKIPPYPFPHPRDRYIPGSQSLSVNPSLARCHSSLNFLDCQLEPGAPKFAFPPGPSPLMRETPELDGEDLFCEKGVGFMLLLCCGGLSGASTITESLSAGRGLLVCDAEEDCG